MISSFESLKITGIMTIVFISCTQKKGSYWLHDNYLRYQVNSK